MRRLLCARLLACACLLVSAAAAQTPAPEAETAAPANGSPEWSVGPIEFSGLIDGYYSLNFNHPASRDNQLRNFDVNANQFSLNMAKLILEHGADPVGFRVDFGFGRAFEIVHGAESGPDIFRNIEQAFVSYKPAAAKGLQLDFGKFVTAAGAEVIETHENWNYSRSLLFAYAIPFYHFGLRASMPLHKNFSAGVYLVNGWNNVEDNNTGKTVGLSGTFLTSKLSWTHTYHVGPENDDMNKGLRHIYDTTLLVTPTSKTSFYVNFDYGVDRHMLLGASRWVGVAGAARFALSPWFALAPRLEWFNDADGFATGSVQKLKEATLTAEFKMSEGVLSRLEYRRDWSNRPFFDRGTVPGIHRNQDTLLAGIVAFFGPRR